jgi:hypothetical protein
VTPVQPCDSRAARTTVLTQIVLGVVVLVATAADIVVTTTSVSSGRGPLSAQVAARVWAVVLAVHRRTRGHRLLQAAGPGGSPQEVLRTCWDGETFGDLDLHLINLAGLLNVTTQMHLAYPVPYYFHTPYRDFALAPSVVVLDETLTLIERALERRPGLSDSAWQPTRAAVDQLLRVVSESVVGLDPETPPRPDLDGLCRDGLPLHAPERIADGINAVAGRRRVLRALLAFEGRQWPPDDELRAHEPLGADADRGAAG